MNAIAPFFSARDYTWKLALTSAIPLDLRSSQAVGEQNLDLTGLNLTGLDSTTAIGRNTVTLPASGSFEGKASVAIGELVVRVPKGAPVEIKLDTAIAGVTYPADFVRNGDIIRAPAAQSASNPIFLSVNVPIGGLVVEYLP